MTEAIAALKLQPVPSSAAAMAKKEGYRARVRIAFDGAAAKETCVDLRAAGVKGVNHYNTPANPPYYEVIPGSIPQLWVREGVAKRLADVNARLAGAGLELYLFDAWRPQAVQVYFHDHWFPRWLKAQRPDLDGAALTAEVQKYWSAPTSSANSPSPHATGGAVDLTLVFKATAQPLFMGGMFDDVTDDAWTDALERRAPVSMSDDEARANRRLLYRAMSEAGFANNPTEWWHYSYGDQMWAALTGRDTALYGAWEP